MPGSRGCIMSATTLELFLYPTKSVDCRWCCGSGGEGWKGSFLDGPASCTLRELIGSRCKLELKVQFSGSIQGLDDGK